MTKCQCILGSGANKGKQCNNNAKPGSLFCGVHKQCAQSIQIAPAPKAQTTKAPSEAPSSYIEYLGQSNQYSGLSQLKYSPCTGIEYEKLPDYTDEMLNYIKVY